MTSVPEILAKRNLTRADIITLLAVRDIEDMELIRKAAEQTLLKYCSDTVHWRGLIEFSNECRMNCHYCGIRCGNKSVKRYTLSEEEIVEAAKWCATQGYGSVVLQSGERNDEESISFVERTVRRIKVETVSKALPLGLGITLCVGEQSPETYRRFFEAGAHRYLLRIETTNRKLFESIHPPSQRLDTRLACLRSLKESGFQVGTGVMIGLPSQTIEMLAADILFFREYDIDMIGMGPYIPHPDTPLGKNLKPTGTETKNRLQLGLLMIAMTRLFLKNVNIAATTALQALDPTGREQGLLYGANILMPQLTPSEHRKDYLLYPNKPCLGEDRSDCAECLAARIRSVGRKLGLNEWGDSRHSRKPDNKQSNC
ncbi:MAG: [FeFe] hydrogenase H-cluster radical SAM maturase HydE [Lentisphaerae bacterium RIFOXYA12_FULL_48_11]|nr:MAG: [FeFe] hydrogenase H-cluster radical SAM maturase HydE [Lentisphaerae bacterium RIFOXYA12_FULL_48_11]